MLRPRTIGPAPRASKGNVGLALKRAFGVERLRLRSRPSRQERQLTHRLRHLGLGRDPLSIEPLVGGISNHNFLVRSGRNALVARICQERPHLGIDRRNEVVCQKAAWSAGLAPELVHHEPGLLLIRFIAGRTLAAGDLHAPEMLARLAAVLRRLHESWDALTGEMLYFCPFQTARTYARTAAQLGAPMPPDIDELLAFARARSREIRPVRPVLCHNDLLPANLIEDDARLWLVDWEYAGIGHPLFDLANASASARLSEEEEWHLLEAYRGQVDAQDLNELHVFKVVSFLRESLWSLIQGVASEIAFDYRHYAAENLRSFRDARRRLESTLSAGPASADFRDLPPRNGPEQTSPR
jgi:thiamine kinase-like enzyme